MRTVGVLQTFEGTKSSMPYILYPRHRRIENAQPMMRNKERENNKPELKLHSSQSILVFLR